MDEEFYKNFTKRIGSKHSFENRNSRTSLNFVEYKTLEIQKAYNKTLVA
jgi:hypothetical protein